VTVYRVNMRLVLSYEDNTARSTGL